MFCQPVIFRQNQQKLPYSQPLIWVSFRALRERAKYGKALTKIICERNGIIFDEVIVYSQNQANCLVGD
jgi:hypothetical protein